MSFDYDESQWEVDKDEQKIVHLNSYTSVYKQFSKAFNHKLI